MNIPATMFPRARASLLACALILVLLLIASLSVGGCATDPTVVSGPADTLHPANDPRHVLPPLPPQAKLFENRRPVIATDAASKTSARARPHLLKKSFSTVRLSLARSGRVKKILAHEPLHPIPHRDHNSEAFSKAYSGFLSENYQALGLASPDDQAELQQLHVLVATPAGQSTRTWLVTWVQLYEGVPLLHGIVRGTFDKDSLRAVVGEIIPRHVLRRTFAEMDTATLLDLEDVRDTLARRDPGSVVQSADLRLDLYAGRAAYEAFANDIRYLVDARTGEIYHSESTIMSAPGLPEDGLYTVDGWNYSSTNLRGFKEFEDPSDWSRSDYREIFEHACDKSFADGNCLIRMTWGADNDAVSIFPYPAVYSEGESHPITAACSTQFLDDFVWNRDNGFPYQMSFHLIFSAADYARRHADFGLYKFIPAPDEEPLKVIHHDDMESACGAPACYSAKVNGTPEVKLPQRITRNSDGLFLHEYGHFTEDRYGPGNSGYCKKVIEEGFADANGLRAKSYILNYQTDSDSRFRNGPNWAVAWYAEEVSDWDNYTCDRYYMRGHVFGQILWKLISNRTCHYGSYDPEPGDTCSPWQIVGSSKAQELAVWGREALTYAMAQSRGNRFDSTYDVDDVVDYMAYYFQEYHRAEFTLSEWGRMRAVFWYHGVWLE